MLIYIASWICHSQFEHHTLLIHPMHHPSPSFSSSCIMHIMVKPSFFHQSQYSFFLATTDLIPYSPQTISPLISQYHIFHSKKVYIFPLFGCSKDDVAKGVQLHTLCYIFLSSISINSTSAQSFAFRTIRSAAAFTSGRAFSTATPISAWRSRGISFS